ncbi:MAG: ATP-binding protein, partial [Bacteroidia bacterium]|nr:ATP-binding protein [Bacteroidia bacterium]
MLENNTAPYVREVQKLGLDKNERLVLMLALCPHIQPDALDICLEEKYFTRTLLGGRKPPNYRGFLPTGQTALFLLGGEDINARNQFRYLFDPQHIFAQKGVLSLTPVAEGLPPVSGTLTISEEYLHILTTGQPYE